MEDKFKNKLEGLNVDWDKEKVWDKLEPQLPEKRNYFLLFFILGLITFGGIYFGYDNSNNSISPKQLKATDFHNTVSNKSASDSSTERQILTKSIGNVAQEKIAQFNSKSSIDSSTIAPIISKSNTKASTIFETFNSILNAKTDHTNTITTKNNETKNALIKNKFSVKQPDQLLAKTNDSIQTKKQTTFQHHSKNSKNNLDNKNADLPIAFQSILPFSLLHAKQLSLIEGDLITKPFKPDYQEINKKDNMKLSKFHIDLIVSVGLPFRKVTGNGQVLQDSSTRAFYKKFELPKLYTGIGANLGYRLTPNLRLSTGLNFETVHETLEWSGKIGQETDVIQYEKAFYVLENNGDSTFYAGPSKVINNSTRHVVHRNKLSYFSIPLALSISKAFHPITISVTAGLHWGFASKFSGKYIDVENNSPMIKENENINFSNRFGWNTRLTSSLHLGKLSRLNIGIAFKNHNSFELDEIELKYRTLALNIGYRKLF